MMNLLADVQPAWSLPSFEQCCDMIFNVAGQPIEQAFVQVAGSMSLLGAGVATAVGLVLLLYGLKVFRVVVVLNAAYLGAMLGLIVNHQTGVGWWAIPASGLVLAILAWPLMRVAVALMAGLAGGLLGLLVGSTMLLDSQFIIAAAAIGLLVSGLLAFVVFRAIIICLTALEGAAMAAIGLAGLVMSIEPVRDALAAALDGRPLLLAALVLLPAAVGCVYQSSCERKRRSPKSS